MKPSLFSFLPLPAPLQWLLTLSVCGVRRVPQEQALYHMSLDFLYHRFSAVHVAMTQAHIY